eukprot:260372_1
MSIMSSTNSVNVILFAGGIFLFWLIYIPLICGGLAKYTKFKDEIFIQKRYPLITKIQIICVLILIGFEYTLNLTYRTIIIDPYLYNLLYTISLLLQPLCVYAAFYSVCWRFWMVFYDTNLAYEAASKLWKVRINSSIQHELNWFERNKLKYGTCKLVGYKIFIMYIISVIISSFCWFMVPYISYAAAACIDFIIFSVPYLGIFICSCKIPSFYDDLRIREEMKLVTKILTISIIIYFIALGLAYQFPDYISPIIVISIISSASCVTFVSYINTYWVVKHINMWLKSSNKYTTISTVVKSDTNTKSSKKLEPPPEQSTHSIESTDATRTKSNILSCVNLKYMLENETLFQAFLEHLNEEWSLELLLSLIEIVQFQQVIIEYINDNNYSYEHIININFPNYVPESEIVFDSIILLDGYTKWKEIKYRACLLYIKYIKNESKYQVNLSYELRSRFDNLMENKDLWVNECEEEKSNNENNNQSDVDKQIKFMIKSKDLLNMFNEVSVEMIQLLEYSFNRYKHNLNEEEMELVYGKTQMTVNESSTKFDTISF